VKHYHYHIHYHQVLSLSLVVYIQHLESVPFELMTMKEPDDSEYDSDSVSL